MRPDDLLLIRDDELPPMSASRVGLLGVARVWTPQRGI